MHGDPEADCDSEVMITAKVAPVKEPPCLPNADWRLFVTDPVHSEECNGVELLRVSDNSAITFCPSQGILATIRNTFPIKDVISCRFSLNTFGSSDVSHELLCQCFVGDTELRFVSKKQQFNFYLPFSVRKVIACSFGVIIEREKLEDEEFPHLFSLSHPYKEILPVLCNQKESPNEWVCAFERDDVQIAGCDGDFVVVYDALTQLHRIYKMRKSVSSEWESARRTELKRMETVTPRQSYTAVTPERTAVTPGTPGMRTRSMTANTLAKMVMMSKKTPRARGIHTPQSAASVRSCESATLGRFWGTPGAAAISPFNGTVMSSEDDLDELPGHWRAEVCMELVWCELPRMERSRGMTTKVFLSSDLTGTLFINFISPQPSDMCSLRIVQNHVPTSALTRIPCMDAVPVKDAGLTVVLDQAGHTQLYSGNHRVCLLVMPDLTNNPIKQLYRGDAHQIVAETKDKKLRLVQLAPMFTTGIAQDLWNQVMAVLGRERALKLSVDFRLSSHHFVNAQEELRQLLNFLLQQLGIILEGHPWLHKLSPMDEEEVENMDEPVSVKQRRPAVTTDDDLLQKAISFGSSMFCREPERCHVKASVDSKCQLSSHILPVYGALHAVYMELTLKKTETSVMRDLADVLYCISATIGQHQHSQYYFRNFPELNKIEIDTETNNCTLPSQPARAVSSSSADFCIFDLVEQLLSSQIPPTVPSSATPYVCSFMMALAVGFCRVINVMDIQRMFGRNWGKRLDVDGEAERKVVDIIGSIGVSAATKCERLLHLFGFTRWDVEKLPSGLGLVLGDVLLRQNTRSHLFKPNTMSPYFRQHPSADELRLMIRMRWPYDIRFSNIEALLCSSRLFFIPPMESVNEADLRDMQEQFVLAVAIRTMTQAFGRALLYYSSEAPAPNEWTRVQELSFAGRTYPGNNPIELSIGDSATIRSARDWGDFFNGVATGLRVKGADEIHLLGEWIQTCYQENQRPPSGSGAEKNPKPSAAAAGMLLAFGLSGHLPSLNIYNVHEMLAQQDRFTSLALVLGYAASKVGTGDEQVNKIIVTHLPFLMGPTMLEVNIDPLVQTAALCALGILFAERGSHTLVHQLINEMGKAAPSESEPTQERYAYALSTGFALGMIGVGKGSSLIRQVPIADHKPGVVRRLLVLMEGGPRNKAVFNSDPPVDVNLACEEGGCKPESNHTNEADRVNVHLTAHPATIALGLLFMKTGDKEVEFILRLPNTIAQLETIRPDVVPVRVISRALVMWDSIEPTMVWVLQQVPAVVRKYVYELPTKEQKLNVDWETVTQTYVHAVAGACFVLALKYVATHDIVVRKIIMDLLSMLLPECNRSPMYDKVCEICDKGSLAVAVNLMLYSLGMVMVGSGDVEVIRICRLIRRMEPVSQWYKNSYSHSTQMAVHTVLGMTFMGYARFSFKNDNVSLASLIIAFYPMANHHIADNRTYLQPLRFMCVLAAERRLIAAVGTESGALVAAPVTVELKNPLPCNISTILCQAPCVLPPLDMIKSIKVGGGRVEQVTLDLSTDRKLLETTLRSCHGRLPVSVPRNICEAEPLSSKGLKDPSRLSGTDSVVAIWRTNVGEEDTGAAVNSELELSKVWCGMKESVEAEVEKFLTDYNAYPIRNHLENLHRESVMFTANASVAASVRVVNCLAQSRDTISVSKHMAGRLLEGLRKTTLNTTRRADLLVNGRGGLINLAAEAVSETLERRSTGEHVPYMDGNSNDAFYFKETNGTVPLGGQILRLKAFKNFTEMVRQTKRHNEVVRGSTLVEPMQ